MSVFPYEKYRENRNVIEAKIREILPSIPSILFSNKDTFNEIHDGLTQDIPRWYAKEKLEDTTKTINEICDAIFIDFITLLRIIVVSKSEQTVEVFQLSAPEFEKRLGIKLSSDAILTQNLFIESKPYKREFRQLLIVQNAPERIIKEIERIKNQKDDFFALLLSLNPITADAAIKDLGGQKRLSESVKSKDIWSDRLVRMDVPRDSTFDDIINVVLYWIDAVEEMEDKDLSDWIEEGNRAREGGNYETALSLYDKALELDPKSIMAWYNKGLTHFQLEKYEEAIHAYDIALEIDPLYVEAWNKKGLALYSLGKQDEAIKCYDKAIELNPNDADAWNKKGVALYDLSRFEEAIECFDKALEIDPLYVEAWNKKGLTLDDFGKHEEAIECFDKALEIDPLYVEAWNKKGAALNILGRYQEAIECFDKALEISPRNGEALYGRAVSYARLKNARNVIADLRKAIEAGKVDDKDFYRKQALEDKNFDNIRDSSRFKQLVGLDQIEKGHPASPTQQYRVFISYAKEDFDKAKRLYEDLKKAGANPWLNEYDILPGQSTVNEIKKAIKNSIYFIALFSSKSIEKRGPMQQELKYALDKQSEFPESAIYLIPVRLDDCTISDEKLKEFQYVDLFPDWDRGLNKILQALKIESIKKQVTQPIPANVDEIKSNIENSLVNRELALASAGTKYVEENRLPGDVTASGTKYVEE